VAVGGATRTVLLGVTADGSGDPGILGLKVMKFRPSGSIPGSHREGGHSNRDGFAVVQRRIVSESVRSRCGTKYAQRVSGAHRFVPGGGRTGEPTWFGSARYIQSVPDPRVPSARLEVLGNLTPLNGGHSWDFVPGFHVHTIFSFVHPTTDHPDGRDEKSTKETRSTRNRERASPAGAAPAR